MQDVGKEVTNNKSFEDRGCWCYLRDQPMTSSSNSQNKKKLSLSNFSALLYSQKVLPFLAKMTSIYTRMLGFYVRIMEIFDRVLR